MPDTQNDKRSGWKTYCLGMLTVYLFAAVLTGLALHRAIPPLNPLGMIYTGAAWPITMFCAASGLDNCDPLPPAGSPLANALFTFSEDQPNAK